MEQCCTCILCFLWLFKIWKYYFQKKHAVVCLKDIPWKLHRNSFDYSIKERSEAPIFRKHHNFAIYHRNQWKQLVPINERVSWFNSWRILFSVVPIHGTVHHKNESWSDGSSLFRKNQKCSFVKCMRVIGNFSLMLSIFQHLQLLIADL